MKYLHDSPIVTDELLSDLRRDEGYRQRDYVDTTGHKTIGYGTNIADGVSRGRAEALMRYDIDEIVAELESALSREGHVSILWHPPPVQRAIANMAYNLGVPRLMRFRKMWIAFDKRAYAEASEQALDSLWAKQVGKRATIIASLIRQGDV